jgi:hypothetical protein
VQICRIARQANQRSCSIRRIHRNSGCFKLF